MATLQQILSEQQKLFAEAKARLEAAHRKPPPVQAAVAVKEKALVNARTRIENLVRAKEDAIQRFNGQIAAYKQDVARLEKEIEQYKKNLGLEKGKAKKKPTKTAKKK